MDVENLSLGRILGGVKDLLLSFLLILVLTAWNFKLKRRCLMTKSDDMHLWSNLNGYLSMLLITLVTVLAILLLAAGTETVHILRHMCYIKLYCRYLLQHLFVIFLAILLLGYRLLSLLDSFLFTWYRFILLRLVPNDWLLNLNTVS